MQHNDENVFAYGIWRKWRYIDLKRHFYLFFRNLNFDSLNLQKGPMSQLYTTPCFLVIVLNKSDRKNCFKDNWNNLRFLIWIFDVPIVFSLSGSSFHLRLTHDINLNSIIYYRPPSTSKFCCLSVLSSFCRSYILWHLNFFYNLF